MRISALPFLASSMAVRGDMVDDYIMESYICTAVPRRLLRLIAPGTGAGRAQARRARAPGVEGASVVDPARGHFADRGDDRQHGSELAERGAVAGAGGGATPGAAGKQG